MFSARGEPCGATDFQLSNIVRVSSDETCIWRRARWFVSGVTEASVRLRTTPSRPVTIQSHLRAERVAVLTVLNAARHRLAEALFVQAPPLPRSVLETVSV